jgi:hypothetical protein
MEPSKIREEEPMGGISTPKSPPAPKVGDETDENIILSDKLRRLRAKGYRSTMLTAGTDLGAPAVAKKTLLGE